MPEAAAPQLSSSREQTNAFAPELGWISIEEIGNVFREMLMRLDKEVMPDNGRWSKPDTLKLFESTKFELFKRSRRNYQEFLKFHPEVKGYKEAPDSRDAYQKRMESLKGR